MADASTVYQIVTEFISRDASAVAGARRVRHEFGAVDRQVQRTQRSMLRGFMPLTGGLNRMGIMFGGVGAGMTAAVAGGLALRKTFQNLNQAAETTLALGAQFNLAFQFSKDPAANMVASLGLGQKFMRDMASDAARLPGELSDFQRAMGVTGLPILAAGGGLDTIRKTLGNLSIVAPMASQNMADAGAQTARMLFGQADTQNPLFGLLKGAGLLPGADVFNKLPQPERLRLVVDAFDRLGANPLFRSRLVDTFSVQLGTLKDNLFGVTGVLGQLGAGPFEGLVGGMKSLNEGIATHGPAIVDGVGGFVMGLRQLADLIPFGWLGSGGGAGNVFERMKAQADTGPLGIDKLFGLLAKPETRALAAVLEKFGPLAPPNHPETRAFYAKKRDEFRAADALMDPATKRRHQREKEIYDQLGMTREGWLLAEVKRKPGFGVGGADGAKTSRTVVNVHNTINVDVKTDASPEGIALAISREQKKLQLFPTRAARHPRMVPSTSTSP